MDIIKTEDTIYTPPPNLQNTIDNKNKDVGTIDNLANVYATIHGHDYQNTRKTPINNIANTMTDRCAANHAAIERINEAWGNRHKLDKNAHKTQNNNC